MSTLGTAYVQIVPSAKGISGSISKALGNGPAVAGTKAGGMLGGSMSKGLLASGALMGIGAAAGAAVLTGIKSSIQQGAALEQSLGGIETMFKNHSGKVIKNADKAYKTAGISANTYMEQATSFSASLLQSLDGDTKKAAKSANMAIKDMADNSNKFGSDIESIQYAYQGFAKQNYTMLDNLKLGYGGTRTEMERLLKDAEKISGTKYDISNLNDVYNAINVIQKKMGVTGTTAKEAAETLSGSFASMKASASNFMANLALGRNVNKSLKELGKTATTFFFGNFLPAIGRMTKAIPGLIATGLDGLANYVTQNSGKMQKSAGKFIGEFIVGIVKNLPKIIKSGLKLSFALIKGTLTAGPEIRKAAVKAVGKWIKGTIDSLSNKSSYIKSKITKPFTGAWGKIRETLNKIRDKVKNLKLKLPFKIPKISLSGGKAPWGIAGKGKLPNFGVTWHKEGGIFTQPTLLGTHGVGEAGAEAVLPLKPLWKKFDNMTRAMASMDDAREIHVHVNIDGKEVAEVTAPYMQTKLDKLQARANRRMGVIL